MPFLSKFKKQLDREKMQNSMYPKSDQISNKKQIINQLNQFVSDLQQLWKAEMQQTQVIDSEDGEEIIDYDKAEKLKGDVTIPNSMTEIPGRLFDENKGITSVNIPGTVKRIGIRAFADCKNLETVILNEGIEEICANVFTGCYKLRSVTYPDSVTKYQGWTFFGTKLSEPVMNVSKTILIFCPKSVSKKEWYVPDSVKIIAHQAFIEHKKLKSIHLPEGLKIIENKAFIECGLREITIPYSVQEIGENAFWDCKSLEKVTILNSNTKVSASAFGGCESLNEINYGDLKEPDKIFHLKGQTFLIQNIETPANLNHKNDPEFKHLTSLCAKGDVNAMNDLANWFDKWSYKSNASLFYTYAANYWRYRAYCRGNLEAVKWFKKYFSDHPNEKLNSILYESNNHDSFVYAHLIPGALLNDLGFDFFDPKRDYEIKQLEGEKIVEVSSFEKYYEPDEDGFGAETYYEWWFLDDNMQSIPEVYSFVARIEDKNQSYFMEKRAKALEIVSQNSN